MSETNMEEYNKHIKQLAVSIKYVDEFLQSLISDEKFNEYVKAKKILTDVKELMTNVENLNILVNCSNDEGEHM